MIRRSALFLAMVATGCSRPAPEASTVPLYDNLDTIAAHALAWEEKLLAGQGFIERRAASA